MIVYLEPVENAEIQETWLIIMGLFVPFCHGLICFFLLVLDISSWKH